MQNDFNQQFAKRLRDTIDRRPQVYISKRIGISQNTLSNWMRGNIPQSIEVLAQLSKELDVDLNWLITGKETKNEKLFSKIIL